MSSFPAVRRACALIVALSALACSAAPKADPPAPEVSLAPPIPAQAVPVPARVHALLINGGGNVRINYHPHLEHLRELHALLIAAGLAPEDISVLASDGMDPGPDLTTREQQPEEDFWRLAGTRAEGWFRMPLTAVDSKLPNVELRPATKAELTRWFEVAATELAAGDTLLVYVTDHGTRHGPDPYDNRITLWGKDEHVTVRELGALFEKLDPGVRIVNLMSQCFSGGFSELVHLRQRDGEPSGSVCGYYASTADRPAYGCFPENVGKNGVGHSFEFLRALARSGSFSKAHEDVLVHDATPDVPLRTSDTYLRSVLERDASERGEALEVRADALLREAFVDQARWEAETRLLDRIAQAAGSFSPRSLAEVAEVAQRLPEIDEQLKLVKRAWEDALSDANSSTFDQFLAASPDWGARLSSGVPAGSARATAASLLSDLRTFTMKDPETEARVQALHRRGEDSEAASYRMQVRLAVVLRMRTVLLSIAGRQLLRTAGSPAQKAALDAVLACEDLTLPLGGAAGGRAVEAPVAPFPPFEEDLKLTRDALPGYLGIRFRDPGDDLRARHRLPQGASVVQHVYPESPASKAGLLPGDIVLGPPGSPFVGKNQIRAWTMLSEIGKPGELEVLRDGKRRRFSIVPDPFPMKWPAMPGPVQVGTDAPKIELSTYRGAVAKHLNGKGKRLLYFWATWCGPCKQAVPELLALEREQNIPVVAITDEGRDTLDAFMKKFSAPFPNTIAMDPHRRAFIAYGVSGTPTFVLVDEQGKVAFHQVGYTPKGLTIPGWTWAGRPASKP